MTADHNDHKPAPRDPGLSLVEVVVAIALLATVGLGMLGALRSTVIGTRTERDHAKAYQWLQSADGVLQAAPRVSCTYSAATDVGYTSGEEKVRRQYEQLIRDRVVNPDGWQDFQIKVLYPVRIWDGTNYWEPAVAPKPCFDSDGYLLQLIELQVSSPDGRIIESTQVVKRD